jgi:hypothetical protein
LLDGRGSIGSGSSIQERLMESRTVAAYNATDEAADGLALGQLLAELAGGELVVAQVLGDVSQGATPGFEVPDRERDRKVRAHVAETRRAVMAAVLSAGTADVVPVLDRRLARGLHEFAAAEDAGAR